MEFEDGTEGGPQEGPEDDMEEISEPTVIFDRTAGICHPGDYSGGIIVKLQNSTVRMIFSDHIQLFEASVDVSGLAIGISKGKATSSEQHLHLDSLANIVYIVRLDPEIVKEFDNSRFSVIYPNIVRFLQTTILYHVGSGKPIDHLDFVEGEILHRPVAILKNHGLIIGDRLVSDIDSHLVFYDCIIIGGIPQGLEEKAETQQEKESHIFITYEHFFHFLQEQVETIFLLGTENF